MAGVNKVTVIGNLGRDPELRYTPGGQQVVQFSVASSRSWKDKTSDEWQEETTWFRCTAWGDLAERIAENARKGNQVYLEGRLRTREYAVDGCPKGKHFAWEIIVNEYRLLERKREGGATSEEDAYVDSQARPVATPTAATSPIRPPEESDLDELPF